MDSALFYLSLIMIGIGGGFVAVYSHSLILGFGIGSIAMGLLFGMDGIAKKIK